MTDKDIGPAKKFEKELASVFVRWWEESDIEDTEMAEIAIRVIERFCVVEVEYEDPEEDLEIEFESEDIEE